MTAETADPPIPDKTGPNLQLLRFAEVDRHPGRRADRLGADLLALPPRHRQGSARRFFALVWTGGFGSSFSIQNSLQRAAPLILTGLAFAIPARIGLIIIGGEGALVLGGFAAAAIAIPLVIDGVPPLVTLPIMALAGDGRPAASGSASPAGCKYARGVNETIASLLMTYIAIAIMNFFVEGALRDPASANKPSTMPIGDAYRDRHDPGHRRALGPRRRHRRLPSCSGC